MSSMLKEDELLIRDSLIVRIGIYHAYYHYSRPLFFNTYKTISDSVTVVFENNLREN